MPYYYKQPSPLGGIAGALALLPGSLARAKLNRAQADEVKENAYYNRQSVMANTTKTNLESDKMRFERQSQEDLYSALDALPDEVIGPLLRVASQAAIGQGKPMPGKFGAMNAQGVATNPWTGGTAKDQGLYNSTLDSRRAQTRGYNTGADWNVARTNESEEALRQSKLINPLLVNQQTDINQGRLDVAEDTGRAADTVDKYRVIAGNDAQRRAQRLFDQGTALHDPALEKANIVVQQEQSKLNVLEGTEGSLIDEQEAKARGAANIAEKTAAETMRIDQLRRDEAQLAAYAQMEKVQDLTHDQKMDALGLRLKRAEVEEYSREVDRARVRFGDETLTSWLTMRKKDLEIQAIEADWEWERKSAQAELEKLGYEIDKLLLENDAAERERNKVTPREPITEVKSMSANMARDYTDILQYQRNPDGSFNYDKPVENWMGEHSWNTSPQLSHSLHNFMRISRDNYMDPQYGPRAQAQFGAWGGDQKIGAPAWAEHHGLVGTPDYKREDVLAQSIREKQGFAQQAYAQAAGPDQARLSRESQVVRTLPRMQDYYNRYMVSRPPAQQEVITMAAVEQWSRDSGKSVEEVMAMAREAGLQIQGAQ